MKKIVSILKGTSLALRLILFHSVGQEYNSINNNNNIGGDGSRYGLTCRLTSCAQTEQQTLISPRNIMLSFILILDIGNNLGIVYRLGL